MKIYVNRIPVNGPYGGGNHAVTALHRYINECGHQLIPPNDQTTPADAILIMGLQAEVGTISIEQAVLYKACINPSCKLVMRVNENDARKDTRGMDSMLIKYSEHVDGTIFVSHWLQEYFEKQGWRCPNKTVIINGVDHDVFKPGEKLNDGKVNICSHHWSNNRMKGADVYEKLDELVGKEPDKFTYTYIGRPCTRFKNARLVGPTFGKSLGDELGKYDVYVSASRFDPGPNHVSEAIVCGLPTYVHADGGGAVEFAGKDHVFRDWAELNEVLHQGSFKPNATQFTGWQAFVKSCIAFIEST